MSENSIFYERLNKEGKERHTKKLKPSSNTLDEKIPGIAYKFEDALVLPPRFNAEI